MLAIIITTIATIANPQLVAALLIALPAKFKPIIIIIGPVTIGGKYFMTFLVPNILNNKARIRYNKPAITIPPRAYANLSSGVIVAYFPALRFAIAAKPPR